MKPFVKNLQAAIFTPGIDLLNKIVLSDQIIKNTKNLFDRDPIILPIPVDAPAQVPRIILKSKNESYSMNISLNRFDFYRTERSAKNGLPIKEISEIKDSYLNKIASITEAIKKVAGVRIVRLGLVMTLQARGKEKAIIFISKSYLKQGRTTENVFDINLGILKRANISGYNANVWFRINPLRMTADLSDDRLLSTVFDINTLPEEMLDLTANGVCNFYASAISHIESKSKLYLKG